jgi:D-sedoheptulose 7-phosphate isomerase
MSINCSGWLESFTGAVSGVTCRCASRLASYDEATDEIVRLLQMVRDSENSVWWVGNGGSSAICSHLSHDLINKLAIRSHVLNDAALITCITNDYGYNEVYLRPLQVLTRSGDLIVAISSSGCSQNILSVTDFARSKGLRLITLSGFDPDNPLWLCEADVSFYLPSHLYGQVEIGHEALLHAVIESLWLKEQAKAKETTSD